MKIAVVGGGIFGCTAAIYAARAGHDVTLFEEKEDLLGGASGHNQFRFHSGYHYPRSMETVQECLDGGESFYKEYAPAINWDGSRYYGIAKEGSLTDAKGYMSFLQQTGLEHGLVLHPSEAWPRWIKPGTLDLLIHVLEARIDPGQLLPMVHSKLSKEGVTLNLGDPVQEDIRENFDQIIVAAYADTNTVLETLGCDPEPYQFEVVEKPVIQVNDSIPADDGVVVLDGPFCSFDPFGRTGLHLLGHVEHAIWERSYGNYPEIPTQLRSWVNWGVISNPLFTKWPIMRDASAEFIPAIAKAKHVGSMYTIRAVLIGKEETDARPTLVHRVDDQVLRIFSGKIPTAACAASQAVELLTRCAAKSSAA